MNSKKTNEGGSAYGVTDADCANRMAKKSLLTLLLVVLLTMAAALPAAAAQAPASAPAVSPVQYEQMVKDTLAELKTAYQQKDLRALMRLASEDFVADDFLLYRAVRRDFRFLDSITLYLYIDSFAVDSKGRAQVAVKYNRNVIANKDGRSYKDSGLTQMTFVVEDGVAKLYDLKFPLIFGLSEGMQVATGVVRTGESVNIMVIDRQGSVSVLPFAEALQVANGASTASGMIRLTSNTTSMEAWDFARNTKVTAIALQGDFAFDGFVAQVDLKAGVKWIDTHATSLASVTQAPNPIMGGYAAGPIAPIVVDKVYALQLASGKFALIQIVDFTGGIANTGTIRYKYQPSGSRNF